MIKNCGSQYARVALFCLVATLAALGSAQNMAADEQPTPAERVAALKAEVAQAEKEFTDAWEKLPDNVDDREIDKIRATFKKKRSAAFDEVLKIAQADPASPAAFAGLEWLLEDPKAYYTSGFATALTLLIEHHAANPELGRGLSIIAYYPPDTPPASELTARLFQTVIEKNPEKTVRGHAALGLAWMAREKFVRADVNGVANARDLAAIAENQFETVLREYGDCPNLGLLGDRRRTATLGEEAESELFELRRLQVGQPAPEIEDQDLAGTKFKLSDYRGKVTLLVFWASWCGSCMQRVPHENELSAHFAGRPFVLIGVNGDDTREAAQATAKQHAISWRSFWNGERGGGRPDRRGLECPPLAHDVHHRPRGHHPRQVCARRRPGQAARGISRRRRDDECGEVAGSRQCRQRCVSYCAATDALARAVSLATTAPYSLRGGQPGDRLGALAVDVIEHDPLGPDKLRSDIGHGRRDLDRNARHAVDITMQQVARPNDQASHAHRRAN